MLKYFLWIKYLGYLETGPLKMIVVISKHFKKLLRGKWAKITSPHLSKSRVKNTFRSLHPSVLNRSASTQLPLTCHLLKIAQMHQKCKYINHGRRKNNNYCDPMLNSRYIFAQRQVRASRTCDEY
jgi:hypothetical protein